MRDEDCEPPPRAPLLPWKDMSSAPVSGGRNRQPYAYGPFIWLKAGPETAWGRWRSGVAMLDRLTGKRTSTPGRWVDAEDAPVPFEPEAWSA